MSANGSFASISPCSPRVRFAVVNLGHGFLLGEQADDAVVRNEMLELASVCEDVANNIEDNLTGG